MPPRPSFLSPAALDDDLHALLDRFEAAWQERAGGVPPRWQDFLPPPGRPCPRAFVFELLALDVHYRLAAGLPALLAEPSVADERLRQGGVEVTAEMRVELIGLEYQGRWQRGERPSRQEYLDRFPEHAEALRGLRPRWTCPHCGRQDLPLADERAETARCSDCRRRVPVADLFGPRPGPAGGLPSRSPAVEPPAAGEEAASGVAGTTARTDGDGSAPTPAAAESAAPRRLGRYELGEEIAHGGMGAVFAARDPDLNRELAVKVLRPELREFPDLVRRFLEEAQITAQLPHPAVVPVHDLGRDEHGLPFLVMKLVRGRTLRDLLDARTAPQEELPRFVAVFEQVCQALAFAHSRRVIHRDLKPDNVMVGRFGEVQVMDWGLARVLPEATEKPVEQEAAAVSVVETLRDRGAGPQTAGALGTWAYMPPEQANAVWDRVDARADVFGLGGLLGAILTGQPPFPGSRDEARRQSRRGDLAGALGRLDGCGADAELVALARACLSPEVEGRPRDAGEVARAVAAYQAGVQERLRAAELERAAAEAREEEARARAAAERRARRRVAALLTALAVVLPAGTAISVWQAVRATRAQTVANRDREQAEEDFRTALRAVDRMLVTVGGERLLEVPHMEPVRRQLLEEALSFYEEFLRERGSNPVVRAEAARAYRWAGTIHHWLGQHAKAEENLGRAIDLFEELVKAVPDKDEYRFQLAACHFDRGLLSYTTGRYPEAEEDYRRSVALWEALIGELPERPRRRSELARTLNQLGLVLAETSRYAEAEQTYRRALELWEKLAVKPGLPDDRCGRASALYKLGLVLKYTSYQDPRRMKQAEDATRRSVDLLRKLVKDQPGKPYYRWELGISLNNWASLLWNVNRLKEAEQAYREALAHNQGLAADFPTAPGYRRDLAMVHNNLGLFLARGPAEGKGEAEKAYRQAQALLRQLVQEHPDVPVYRALLASTYHNLGPLLRATGRPGEAEQASRQAEALMRELVAAYPSRPDYASHLAGMLHDLALDRIHKNELEQARQLLHEAIGYQQTCLRINPNDPLGRNFLGKHYGLLGVTLRRMRNYAEAANAYRQALPIQEGLARDFPGRPDYQSDLGATLNNLAILLDRQGELAQARDHVERAIPAQKAAVKANPQHPDYRRFLRNHHGTLAHVLVRQGAHADAVRTAAELPRILPDDISTYCDAALLVARCVPLADKDGQLPEAKRKELTKTYSERVRELLHQAGQRAKTFADQRTLAWTLATGEVPQFRDPARAVELALKAAKGAPKDAQAWCALGVAHYRAGDPKAALAALQTAAQVRQGSPNGFDGFFLALAYWQQDNKEQARLWYDRAVGWMAQYMPDDDELLRFQAEAEEALGLKK
jgi:tetratricopeptide (TPR) repeat protein